MFNTDFETFMQRLILYHINLNLSEKEQKWKFQKKTIMPLTNPVIKAVMNHALANKIK